MKLQIRRLTKPYSVAKQVLVLTDENGVMLPCQVTTSVESFVDDPGKVTVTFVIDGNNLTPAYELEAVKKLP